MKVCRVSSGSCGNNAESGMLRTLKLAERTSTGVTFDIWERVGGIGRVVELWMAKIYKNHDAPTETTYTTNILYLLFL